MQQIIALTVGSTAGMVFALRVVTRQKVFAPLTHLELALATVAVVAIGYATLTFSPSSAYGLGAIMLCLSVIGATLNSAARVQLKDTLTISEGANALCYSLLGCATGAGVALLAAAGF